MSRCQIYRMFLFYAVILRQLCINFSVVYSLPSFPP
nr:MAG TPA: hypothetical protein [Caudoviricetes sp.]